jgi:thiamine biosynthesis lipoprotein
MGTLFRIILYAKDAEAAKRASVAAFDCIAGLDATLSDYKEDSELMRLCGKAGGDPVPVSPTLFEVLDKSQEMSRLSNGAFDVTVGPVVRLWRSSRRSCKLPDPDALARAKDLSGYTNLVLDSNARTARLLKPGMLLDLGAIAKGYANDKALAVLKAQSIASALVVAGGEMSASAAPPGRDGWTVGIAPLENPDTSPTQFILLKDGAVSTSGDAEQFVEIGGTRYSHIVDPRTGLGKTGHSSVTVVAPNGTLSDSLATAVTVLGPQVGLKLADSIPGTAALVKELTADGEKTHASARWKDVPKTGPLTPQPRQE